MASSKIRGITIQIGGDTTGLDKALKKVDGTIKETQDDLKAVNKALKLDPKNTTLLSQKQKALKEAVSATKARLDALKQAQQHAKLHCVQCCCAGTACFTCLPATRQRSAWSWYDV